jgi:hypothetical protein
VVEECVGWSGRMLSLQGLGTSRYRRQTVLAITHTWSMNKEAGNSPKHRREGIPRYRPQVQPGKEEGFDWMVSDERGDHQFSIGLYLARRKRPHDRYASGIHHLALRARSRDDVDELYLCS